MNADQIAAMLERILIEAAETGSIEIAFNAVMGEGAFENMAGNLYDALNVKAAAAATKN